MGEPPDRLPSTAPSDEAVRTVRMVAMSHSQYWKCMYPKGMSLLHVLAVAIHFRR